MIYNNNKGKEYQGQLERCFIKANTIYIACGYFGRSVLARYRDRFKETINRGGNVYIIHGFGAWEGLPNKLEAEVADLHNDLTRLAHTGNKSGIYFKTDNRYHGKIYFFENPGSELEAYIGSSNFSDSGLQGNHEANIRVTDPYSILEIKEYLDSLLQASSAYHELSLPERGVRKGKIVGLKNSPDNFVVPVFIKKQQQVDFTIPIRIKPKSNLNLSFGPGRKNKKGVYKARPYFEVEITIPKAHWKTNIKNHVKNTKNEPVKFDAFTDNNIYFECNFNRKTNGPNDKKGLHENSADFQSTPREALGKYIKEKLISSGVMSYGDLVTEEVLHEYGNDKLHIKVIDKKRLYIEF